MKILHVCEVCGKTEVLTPEEAYDAGWDYPPIMGQFGVVGPRTCGDCGIEGTIWWKIMCKGADFHEFEGKDLEVLQRILNEPESILVEE